MGFITSSTFTILINGQTTDFFNNDKGLRQGFPLSLLLFILVMEGLRLALKRIQVEGTLTHIKVSRLIRILHLLFFDDILIMTKASILEWMEIKKLLSSFYNVIGLMINAHKKSFLQYGVQQQVMDTLKSYFLYNFKDLINGFRYLGYFLKLIGKNSRNGNGLLISIKSVLSIGAKYGFLLGVALF